MQTAVYFCWRPRRDLHPCYRRESLANNRNRLKTEGTVASKMPFRTPEELVLDRYRTGGL